MTLRIHISLILLLKTLKLMSTVFTLLLRLGASRRQNIRDFVKEEK